MILFLAAFLYSIYLLIVFSAVAVIAVVGTLVQVAAFLYGAVQQYLDERAVV